MQEDAETIANTQLIQSKAVIMDGEGSRVETRKLITVDDRGEYLQANRTQTNQQCQFLGLAIRESLQDFNEGVHQQFSYQNVCEKGDMQQQCDTVCLEGYHRRQVDEIDVLGDVKDDRCCSYVAEMDLNHGVDNQVLMTLRQTDLTTVRARTDWRGGIDVNSICQESLGVHVSETWMWPRSEIDTAECSDRTVQLTTEKHREGDQHLTFRYLVPCHEVSIGVNKSVGNRCCKYPDLQIEGVLQEWGPQATQHCDQIWCSDFAHAFCGGDQGQVSEEATCTVKFEKHGIDDFQVVQPVFTEQSQSTKAQRRKQQDPSVEDQQIKQKISKISQQKLSRALQHALSRANIQQTRSRMKN